MISGKIISVSLLACIGVPVFVGCALLLPNGNPFRGRNDALFSPNGTVPFGAAAYSPDGLLYASEIAPPGSGMIAIFDSDTQEQITTIDESHGSASNDLKSLAWSPDSQKLAIMYHGGLNNGIWIRDAHTANLLVDAVPAFTYHYMVFSADGTSLLLSDDGLVVRQTISVME